MRGSPNDAMMTPDFGCHCLKSGVMTAVTENTATGVRKRQIMGMAENSHFLWHPYGRCHRQMRARYLNFLRTLRDAHEIEFFCQ